MKSEVSLCIPGQPEYVRVARMTIAAVASCTGCSVEQIEELKQSVGEACSNAVAVAQRAGGQVGLECDILEDEMVIHVSPVAFGPEDIKDERTEFQLLLIKSLMDSTEMVPGENGEQKLRMKRDLER